MPTTNLPELARRVIMIHAGPKLQDNLIEPPDITETAEHRKHRVGAVLRFKNYSADEVAIVPTSTFRRGDLLRVLGRNGCGMGIDVQRLTDGKVDMVWPEEATYSKYQAELSWNETTLWVNGPDICLARYDTKGGGKFDVHRSAHDQAISGQQCLDCGQGNYEQFRAALLRYHNLELPDAKDLEGFGGDL